MGPLINNLCTDFDTRSKFKSQCSGSTANEVTFWFLVAIFSYPVNLLSSRHYPIDEGHVSKYFWLALVFSILPVSISWVLPFFRVFFPTSCLMSSFCICCSSKTVCWLECCHRLSLNPWIQGAFLLLWRVFSIIWVFGSL